MLFASIVRQAVGSLASRLRGEGPETPNTESGVSASAFHGQQPSSGEVGALASLYGAGRFEELESLARAITVRVPDHGMAWKVLGIALLNQGRAAEALPAMLEAASLLPGDAEAQNNLGVVLQREGRHAEAELCFRHALLAKPESADAHYNLGNTLLQQGRAGEAETSLRRALRIAPEFAEAHRSLGIALANQGSLTDAEACYRRSLSIKPDFAEAHYDLGCALAQSNRFDEAAASFLRTLELEPNYAGAQNSLGGVYAGQNRLAEAEASFRKAVQAEPGNAAAHNNLGAVLRAQDRPLEAEASCRRALHLDPEHGEAHQNLGISQADQGRFDEAEASLRQALNLRPESTEAQSNLLFTLNYHPDRSAEHIFRHYREYDARVGAPLRSGWRDHTNEKNPRRRLRIGYVSPDFRRHSGRSFLEPLLANHDKNQVEVFAYAALTGEDEVTVRYRRYADHWISVQTMTDDAISARIRDDRIDILVDLAGHNAGNLLKVFARKPAPISVSWLGYGYTTGLSAIDFYLTDAVCAPPGSEELFAERLWRIETPGYVFQPTPGMGEVSTLPALDRGHITFGTLTRSIRINYRVIRVWAYLLQAVPGSRLVVDSGSYRDPAEQERLAASFAQHGIGRERLEIGFHSPPWDVLRDIDIGLDCFPHNSGTTLFESIYMGVPFITLAGRPSVGRLGSSILYGLQRPQWIAANESEYVAKAAALAADPAALAVIRAGLRDEMERTPLRDERGFARRVEAAYRQMFGNWCEAVR